MRTFLAALAAALSLGMMTAPAALADCVDYSQARAERAGAALERNPPSAAQLGLPSLDGWDLDGIRTTGDPACNGSGPPQYYYYTTDLTYAQIVEALYPNIRRRTNVDGMGREWFENPVYGSRNEMFLTSGVRLEFGLGSNGRINLILVDPPEAVLPLTTESQPYSVSDIADWTPWPGGGNGPREFVRADGGDSGYRASNNPSQTTTNSETAEARETCPPAGSSGGSNAGSQVGSAIGGAILGGGAGRSVGSALGGMFGSRNRPQQSQTDTENCPQ